MQQYVIIRNDLHIAGPYSLDEAIEALLRIAKPHFRLSGGIGIEKWQWYDKATNNSYTIRKLHNPT